MEYVANSRDLGKKQRVHNNFNDAVSCTFSCKLVQKFVSETFVAFVLFYLALK